MKTIKSKLATLIPVALLALLSTLNSQLSTLFAQGTAFTYQGQLISGTNPANGSYDLTFSLFNISSGAGQVGSTYPAPATLVSNGLFTVVLDFGANFPGADRWLEIAVRTNGSGAFTTLSPRQKLTPAPYAIYSGNAAQLGGQSASAYVAKAGDTMTGALNLPANGLTVGGTQLVVSGGSVSANQIFASFLTCNANSVFAPVQSENPGTGPGVYGLNDSSGVGVLGSSSTGAGVSGSSTGGRGVYGKSTAAGSTVAGVYGENSAAGGTAVVGTALNINSAGVAGVADTSGSTGVYGRGTTYGVFGTSANGDGVYGWSNMGDSSHAGVFGENAAVGGTAVVGNALNINSAGVAGVADTAGSTGVYGRGAAWAGYFDGKVRVCTLTISGGCDVAEPFQISTRGIPKGTVVVIDDQNAGQLKMSEWAYDTRVAGIVSGANGIKPGISLSQEGAIEGGQNVALSGRVYVLADASSSPIKPGDLLTTSPTPGHAMKVTDHAKAHGAILGKAMSALNQGKGMVLVLVTLQ